MHNQILIVSPRLVPARDTANSPGGAAISDDGI